MWALIATWEMSYDAVKKAGEKLKNNNINADKAIVEAISDIEDFPNYTSVGYGGLPNEEMIVELDAAYMDGNDLSFGAVMAIKDYANPIKVAYELSKRHTSCMLVDQGAMKFAQKNGFKAKNMLTESAKNKFEEIKVGIEKELKPYIGHDTVGICCVDNTNKICVGTSTSGLFMKKHGRVGDSPIIGGGLYCDSEIGAATATGLGEDIMKSCLCYQIVFLMKLGYSVQNACEKALLELDEKLRKKREKVGDMSVVAIDKDGNFGFCTNIDNFSFVYASNKQEATIYHAKREGDKMILEKVN